LLLFLLYLLWEVHELAVHKAQQQNSAHIQLVFALSLCGLFLHKAWWVCAIIIAFANWKHIGISISNVIRNSFSNSKLSDTQHNNNDNDNDNDKHSEQQEAKS